MKKLAAPFTSLAPSLKTVPFLKGSPGHEFIRLSDRQRADLARIGLRIRLPARMMVYREDSPAEWVFAVAEGSLKAFRDLPSGKRIIGAFLFPRDLFGLAENGRYLNSAQTITRATLYRLPVRELLALLKHDPELHLHFLAKVTHELRESQRRAILINRRDAAGRLAMFVAAMRERSPQVPATDDAIPLPMSQSDIAGFLGLSLETVSRAARELERRGIVTFPGRHAARIVDPARLARLCDAV